MMRWTLIPIAAMAFACSDGGDTDPDTDPGLEACGENAPVVGELGIQTWSAVFQAGDDPLPALQIDADTTDADGDLHTYAMRVWWDDVIDGRVLPETEFVETSGEVDGGVRCETGHVGFSMILALNGAAAAPPLGTLVEIGVVVIDSANNHSADGQPKVIEFLVPEGDDAEAWPPLD